jgi:hypothetical protein
VVVLVLLVLLVLVELLVVLLVVDEDGSVDVAVVGCEALGPVVVGTVETGGATGAAPAPIGATTARPATPATSAATARREGACASSPHRPRAPRIPSRRVVRAPGGSVTRPPGCCGGDSASRRGPAPVRTAGRQPEVTATSPARRLPVDRQ